MRKTKKAKKPAAKSSRQPAARKAGRVRVASAPSAFAFGVYSKPQRLIVFDGIVDTQLPTILWQDQGIPLCKDGQWPARLLANQTGYLTVLPLHMEGGPLWTQNTNAGNPYIGAFGHSATTVYEDQADGPGSHRPDIIATISAPNVLFSRLSPQELAVLLKKRH